MKAIMLFLLGTSAAAAFGLGAAFGRARSPSTFHRTHCTRLMCSDGADGASLSAQFAAEAARRAAEDVAAEAVAHEVHHLLREGGSLERRRVCRAAPP